jgi:hypothetical protein
MATLPKIIKTMDDNFVNTWYEIRKTVTDNVLNATILTLALKEYGCMKTQVGGEFGWTDTIGYGDKDIAIQYFQRGSTLTQKPVKLDTMGYLDWRYFLVDVNRTFVDDETNAGPNKIKDYVARRLEAARNALVQGIETDLFRYGAYASPRQINALWDVVAPATAIDLSGASAMNTQDSGTANGNIDRTNSWWRNWAADDATSYNFDNKTGAATNTPYRLNLIPDMTNMFNNVSANQESPNLILCSQDIYEAYEDEARDKMQVVRTSFNKKAADLGFEAQTFKGATLSYSQKMPARHMVMLNMNHISWNYNPNVWFDMTNWKEGPNQLERVAYIVCMTPGLVTNQPRRHGVLYWAS